jgi:hypothetical protein
MIVHGCIEIHPKDCGGWIIVTGFRVFVEPSRAERGVATILD